MKLTNKKGFNKAILNSILSGNRYGGTGEERFASVTELINPTRIFWLNKRHADKMEMDVSKRIFMLLGSAVHSILDEANDIPVLSNMRRHISNFFSDLGKLKIGENENMVDIFLQYLMFGKQTNQTGCFDTFLKEQINIFKNQRYLTENRMKMQVSGKIISGGYDLYDKETKYLEDYKLTSVWNWIYRDDTTSRIPEYTEQLNCYKLFLNLAGYEVSGLRINMIFRDYQASKKSIESNYPDEVEPIEIEMWDNEVIKQFIKERVNELIANEKVPDHQLPLCTPRQRWDSQKVWQVFKNANKRATKNCYSYKAAEAYINENSDGKSKYSIVEKESEPKRCIGYCQANKFCDFYIDYMAKKGGEMMERDNEQLEVF